MAVDRWSVTWWSDAVTVAQIDGLSGTGKSTLSVELERRGYCAVDADAEFAYFGDPGTGRPTDIKLRDNWIWNTRKVRAFCEERRGRAVFICGGAWNQRECLDLFTHRFMLCVDSETMRHRLFTRTSNDFGKDPAELAEQLALNCDAEPRARDAGMITIDATRPVAAVADDILRMTIGSSSS